MILQAVVWRDPPGSRTLLGAALIVGGALYVFFTERRRKQALADAMAAEAVAE